MILYSVTNLELWKNPVARQFLAQPTIDDPDATRQQKYLHSAAPIFIATGRRRSEIEAAFGVHFYEKMAADIVRVHKSLGVECPVLL